MLARLKRTVPCRIRLMIYNSLIRPYFEYLYLSIGGPPYTPPPDAAPLAQSFFFVLAAILDFTDVKNVTERRNRTKRRGPGSVFYVEV